MIGNGGGGGQGNYNPGNYSICHPGVAGSPGTASGGSSNVTGGGAPGGSGGGMTISYSALGYGSGGPGGPGGAGGSATITFSNGASGAPASGSGITVVVGSGGAGGASDGFSYNVPGNPGSNGSVSITWTDTPPAPSCMVTISPNPSAYANSGTPVTVSWTSSNATQVYINNIGWVSPSGSTQVASQATTDYSCYGYSASAGDGPWDRTNTTLVVIPPVTPPPPPTPPAPPPSCTSATQYLCSGQTIMASSTSASCQTTQTPVTTCVSPQFCSPGSSTCVSPPPTDTPSSGMSGHLTAKPNLVQFNGLSTVYWNVSNVTNCKVSGTDGTLWSGNNSAASTCASKNKGGCSSLPITGQTIYTLSCKALDDSNYTETATVNVLPNFLER